jgi:hypothetical protein
MLLKMVVLITPKYSDKNAKCLSLSANAFEIEIANIAV